MKRHSYFLAMIFWFGGVIPLSYADELSTHQVDFQKPTEPLALENSSVNEQTSITPNQQKSADQIVTEAEEKIEQIEMSVGDIHIIETDQIARVAVGDGKIVNAMTDSDSEVVLFGREPGTTSLQIWTSQGKMRRYHIVVTSSDEQKERTEILALLSKMPGVTATQVGKNIIVEGEQLSDAQRERIGLLAQHYPQIINMVSHQGWEQMVMLDVQIVEVPRQYLRQLGVSWQQSTQGNFNQGVAWNVLPALQANANQGQSVVLAQPQLMARSGSTAEFLAGGEVPYVVTDAQGRSQTTFKPYGVNLRITPKVLANGAISSHINIEISSVDTSMNLSTGPALKTRRTSTEFNVRSGQTLVLAGFISREQMQGFNQVPGVGDVPVIGELLKSEKFQNNETELAIFVRPTVIKADEKSLQERVNRAQAIVDSSFEKGAVLNVPLDKPMSLKKKYRLPKNSQWVKGEPPPFLQRESKTINHRKGK